MSILRVNFCNCQSICDLFVPCLVPPLRSNTHWSGLVVTRLCCHSATAEWVKEQPDALLSHLYVTDRCGPTVFSKLEGGDPVVRRSCARRQCLHTPFTLRKTVNIPLLKASPSLLVGNHPLTARYNASIHMVILEAACSDTGAPHSYTSQTFGRVWSHLPSEKAKS